MKKQVEFKVGDLVYYPNISNKIGKIVGTSIIANDPYCLKVAIDDTTIFTTKDGRFAVNAPIPVIYHATQKNYEWLSATFPNVEFEPPRKDPKEVIKAMLESDATLIPCLVADYDDNRILDYKKATRHNSSVLIYGISENGRFLSTNPHCSSYKYAVPFDIETGKVIIDFVDGEVVLESENE